MECRSCGQLEPISRVIAGACPACTVKAICLLDHNGVPMTAIRRAIEEIEDGARKVK